ncbi:Predicted PurR-regulated permease PerM [Reichenbachiella agariperforans]|uniref:Predicted PurR-regulated permease PerM n=1 Tax=Reichenbachiella agariperforans TaxID=156994 RepID=A0A1M6M458_REIAG|nr:AI-2E family transporter [Reichenbachiella agariperforans]SHJ78160.1 Predicted PurR-regulated permease PerM [Reichenbachiella agariperforans]
MINRTLLSLILITSLFIFSAWLFSDIFMYICISIVLATILRPMTNFISRTYIFRMKVPRVLAILLSFCSVIGVIALFILLFIPLIVEQINVISSISFDEVYKHLSQPIVATEEFLIEYNLISAEDHTFTSTIKRSTVEVLGDINFQSVLNNVVTMTGGVFVSFMALSFITFFLLLENGIISRLLISIVPNQYFELFISAIHKIEHLLSNYLIGLLLQMLAIFSIAGIGLSIFGVNYALTIAVFAALANLIPYLGPLLGSVFGILVGLSSSGHFALDEVTMILIVKIVSVFAVVQVMDNVVLQPMIFSKSVKAHPLEIFVVIFAAASLAGISGMIAAIPVYTIIRVSVMEIRDGFNSYQVFQVSK